MRRSLSSKPPANVTPVPPHVDVHRILANLPISHSYIGIPPIPLRALWSRTTAGYPCIMGDWKWYAALGLLLVGMATGYILLALYGLGR
jgi:hypothetical protein